MPYEFYLSIDAHESDDETGYAVALIEKSGEETGRKASVREANRPDRVTYRTHALKRYVDAPVDEVVDDVLDQIADEPFTGRTTFVIDIGKKPGRALHAALRKRGVSPMSIAIGGGETTPEQGRALSFSTSADDAVHVSEREIVAALVDIHRSGHLDLDPVKDDETSALVQGLEAYQVESDAEAVEADVEEEDVDESETSMPSNVDLRRTTEHADLILAAGAACWLARQHRFDPTQHLSEPPPPVREAKRSMRPDTAKPRTPTQ